ncbi:MAG: hypothetical protein DMF92_04280 [Acidobacteria bacterium]|nr:MAG: hypothetical protein DMF92_04280 [Acidobacteriota bacterium]
MVTSDDSRLDRAVGRVLNVGVTASSACLAIGLGLSMLGGTAGAARLLLNVGLVVLMATPVGRVIISVSEYAFERDWVFVSLTTIVLLELVGSLLAAFR